MVPPVSGTYQDDIDTWIAEFKELYPHLDVEVIKTSWDDHNGKLSTMANAGEAPDIAEVSYSAIGTYVELGVAVDIAQYMDPERLADYDQNALDYMSIENTVYGLPLYITIQALGANKDMLEAAGADVAKIQSEGWTYEEFLEVIKNGTTDDCFGFVFANSGVTASDFLNIFGVAAGLNNAFTDDLQVYLHLREHAQAARGRGRDDQVRLHAQLRHRGRPAHGHVPAGQGHDLRQGHAAL